MMLIRWRAPRTWRCTILGLALCALFSSGALFAQDAEAPFAITHGPCLQTPGVSEMTITWHTNRAGVAQVQYGVGDALDQTAVASVAGLIPNDTAQHTVRLTNLAPGVTYRYKLITREFIRYITPYVVQYGDTVESGIFTFTTLNPQKTEYSFLMWNDIHDDSKRLKAMFNDVSWEGVDFAVLNGDMINDFMKPEQPFRGFYDACVERFATSLPMVFIRGNHETRGPLARQLASYFPGLDGRFYWSFAHGPAFFIVLDSGEDKPDANKEYAGLADFDPYRAEQTAWLRETLASEAARTAKYRIVLSHQPSAFGSLDHYGVSEIRRLWEPLLTEANAQLWLSGHIHQFMERPPRTDGDNSFYAIINPHDGTVRVDVTPDALRITVIQKGGTVLYSASIPAASEG